MSRTKWTAVMAAVIALGAAGCGGTGAGAGAVAVSPRPEGTGPLTREVVRTDLDTSAAAAKVPATDAEWAAMPEDAEPGTLSSCVVAFKGFETDAAPLDHERFEATLRELGRRGWKQVGKPEQEKDKKGEVWTSKVLLDQRGWRIVAEYRDGPTGKSTISLPAFENACVDAQGGH
ncbi:hypothetical protein OG898_28365 [Streptomyces sp. NBC_00193]|uniref:hypothetical protein n=1 Tax=unclassified Streptomyces TaxID=2593676 RepID=UPI002251017D|nr:MULTISPECIES: hypothetical protein [unclassified Streptomyces]MCX5129976.1 hypothetical protein [Streptomyces sp. NBC_00347]MCX5300348.1 hypothetical protein [Streptomyces sp. NBC_00193]